ncbi:MAG: hypothetical protein JWP46_832 [Modestobacter sp.]|jgi:hypothetical protein|nr:hypothetical protein [Modestobacter sp.]
MLMGMIIFGKSPLTTPLQNKHILFLVMFATLALAVTGLTTRLGGANVRSKMSGSRTPAVRPVATDVAT